MLVKKNFRSKFMNVFLLLFCSRDEKVSFSCHSHLSKSCFLVRCLLKGPINISIRPGFLTFCHLLLTTVRTPAYLQSRRNRWCRGVQCPNPIFPEIERNFLEKNPLNFLLIPTFFLHSDDSELRLQRPQQLP